MSRSFKGGKKEIPGSKFAPKRKTNNLDVNLKRPKISMTLYCTTRSAALLLMTTFSVQVNKFSVFHSLCMLHRKHSKANYQIWPRINMANEPSHNKTYIFEMSYNSMCVVIGATRALLHFQAYLNATVILYPFRNSNISQFHTFLSSCTFEVALLCSLY